MNLFLKNIFLSIGLLAITVSGIAQDIHFSQFFETPLWRNPSLAGIFTGDLRVQGVYRNQWNSVTTPYQTGSFSGEYKMPVGKGDDFLTAGLQILYDRAGSAALTTNHLLPVLNYHKSLSSTHNTYLSLGFMGGWVQRRIDRSKITTNNQFDGSGFNGSLPDGEAFSRPNYSYADGSVGMSFNTGLGESNRDNIYLGVAYHHFNTPKNSFYRDPNIELLPRWTFNGGIKFAYNEYAYLTFHGDYYRQGSYQETIGGAMFSQQFGEDPDRPEYTIHGGAFIRWKDALVPVFKVDYNPFSFAISYDVNLSELKTASQGRGGFELSISYIGFFDRDNSSRNKVFCPRF